MSSKAKPLRAYCAPEYPTIDEIGRADLSRAPVRWARLKSVVASLGTVAMTMKALAQESAPAPAPTIQAPEGSEVKAEPVASEAKPATDVCPLMPVAVAGEGRGAFGCISVNPPVMLSECEALDIIEREFAKRGIKLKDGPELDGVDLPSRPGQRRPVMLDLGNAEGDVLVEFISLGDEKRWSDPPSKDRFTWSSVKEWDLRAVAERARKVLAARTEGRPVTVGVLYDPTVYMPRESGAQHRAESPKEREERRNARRAAGRALAEKQLLAQLEGLFDHLAKQGKLPREQ